MNCHEEILISLQIVLVCLQILSLAAGKIRTRLINENTRITKSLKRELESGRLDQIQ